MQGKGFWFNSTSGEVICVTEGRHVEELCRDPGKFGLTEDRVKDVFQGFNEPLTREGKAREVLILQVVTTTDWVRIREYLSGGRGFWSGNCRDLSTQGARVLTFLREYFKGWEEVTALALDDGQNRNLQGTWTTLWENLKTLSPKTPT